MAFELTERTPRLTTAEQHTRQRGTTPADRISATLSSLKNDIRYAQAPIPEGEQYGAVTAAAKSIRSTLDAARTAQTDARAAAAAARGTLDAARVAYEREMLAARVALSADPADVIRRAIDTATRLGDEDALDAAALVANAALPTLHDDDANDLRRTTRGLLDRHSALVAQADTDYENAVAAARYFDHFVNGLRDDHGLDVDQAAYAVGPILNSPTGTRQGGVVVYHGSDG